MNSGSVDCLFEGAHFCKHAREASDGELRPIRSFLYHLRSQGVTAL